MMKITGLSNLFKWENLHNWWLTKYFFAPLYVAACTVHNLNRTFVRYYMLLMWTFVFVDTLQLRPHLRKLDVLMREFEFCWCHLIFRFI